MKTRGYVCHRQTWGVLPRARLDRKLSHSSALPAGARLLEIGFDRIWLLVQRPPRTAQAAQQVAAEHYAFADEAHGQGDVPNMAMAIVGAAFWSFWWD